MSGAVKKVGFWARSLKWPFSGKSRNSASRLGQYLCDYDCYSTKLIYYSNFLDLEKRFRMKFTQISAILTAYGSRVYLGVFTFSAL